MVTIAHSRSLIPADSLVALVTKTETHDRHVDIRGKLGRFLTDALDRLEFEVGADSVVMIPAPTWSDYRTIVCVGFVEGDDRTAALRYAAGNACRTLTGSAAVAMSPRNSRESDAIAEGALLASTRVPHRKSIEAPKRLDVLTVIGRHSPDASAIEPAVDAVAFVRDLVTEAPNHLGPHELATRVADAARAAGLAVDIFDERALEKGGFGGILGIGAGSARPPRLVTVRYNPRGSNRHIALVGKGITFDTGGLSIKPANSMIGMKYDMTGAATVFAVTRAIAQLKLPITVTAWLCIAENMPSGTAIRPNDVITIRGGKTVEVTNTDAEGRVVLADGLAAASEEQPDAIIDVATLTGAAKIALGDRIAGLMGEPQLVSTIVASAKRVGEEVWAMPLPPYLKTILASDVADIANAKIGHTAGGMLIGGTFLREFVGNGSSGQAIPWAHLDIAGPANNSGSPFGVVPKGATGTMVRTLMETIKAMSETNHPPRKKE